MTELVPPPLSEAALADIVAQRIGSLRRALGLSFDGLAQRAGVAKGTLVQIEGRRANPSISTLCRLAAALGVSVADLVSAPAAPPQAIMAIAPGSGRRLWQGPLGGQALLLAGTPGADMLELWHWVLMPGERFEAATHGKGTREILHVTQGCLRLEVADEVRLIATGGSAIALTDRPHAYANAGDQPLHFTMIVQEPPSP